MDKVESKGCQSLPWRTQYLEALPRHGGLLAGDAAEQGGLIARGERGKPQVVVLRAETDATRYKGVQQRSCGEPHRPLGKTQKGRVLKERRKRRGFGVDGPVQKNDRFHGIPRAVLMVPDHEHISLLERTIELVYSIYVPWRK